MQTKRTVWLLTALVVLLAAALIGVFVFLNNQIIKFDLLSVQNHTLFRQFCYLFVFLP